MRKRFAVTAVAGVLALVPSACGTPTAPSRTTTPRTSVTIPAAVRITLDSRPFVTVQGGGVT